MEMRKPAVAGQFFALFVIAIATLINPVNSFAEGILYASDSGCNLLAIDTADGSSVIVGPTGITPAVGVASDPVSGLWYTRSFSDLYTFDITTGATTLVGPSGTFITGLAFNPTFTTLYSVNQSTGELYTVDPATGTATLVGNTGIATPLDMSTDSNGVLWAADISANIYTIDPATAVATLVAATVDALGLTSISFDPLDNLYGVTLSNELLVLIDVPGATSSTIGGPVQGTDVRGMDYQRGAAPVNTQGLFNVTKTFTDGLTDEVDVTLTCNGGLPLVQEFTIAGDGPGVTFVVNDIPDTGVTCTVTESGGPDGYTPVMNGGAGCSWADVTGGLYTCAITNEADPATFIVNKVWEVNEENGGDDVIRVADITIICDAEIEGGYQDDDDRSEKELPGGIPWPGYDDWMLDGTIVGDGSLEATVDTSMGPVMCEAEESSEQSGVESTDDCGPREIGAGETSECTITNTVFFEGIPSLNQYGLAIMALLMLGMGMVGFRRFV